MLDGEFLNAPEIAVLVDRSKDRCRWRAKRAEYWRFAKRSFLHEFSVVGLRMLACRGLVKCFWPMFGVVTGSLTGTVDRNPIAEFDQQDRKMEKEKTPAKFRRTASCRPYSAAADIPANVQTFISPLPVRSATPVLLFGRLRWMLVWFAVIAVEGLVKLHVV